MSRSSQIRLKEYFWHCLRKFTKEFLDKKLNVIDH